MDLGDLPLPYATMPSPPTPVEAVGKEKGMVVIRRVGERASLSSGCTPLNTFGYARTREM
jgi:hypothetical protein